MRTMRTMRIKHSTLGRFKTPFALIPLLFMLATLASPTQASSTPTSDLKSSVTKIIDILANKGLSEADKRAKIGPLVDARFDYPAMSQRILTSNNWKKASKAEQARFAELFGDLLKKTYFTAISAYNDQTVAFTSEKFNKKKNRAEVRTDIVSPDKRIPVNYAMRLKKDGWFVYDVKVEGVSLVKSHQSTFRNIFKNDGMAGAIEALEDKVKAKDAAG